MQKGGEPLVSRTMTVTKTADNKVWNYQIDENTTLSYSGTITLPDENISSITADNFTNLTAKFDGKLPLRYMDSPEPTGEQNVTLDLEVKKSSTGADIELKDLKIANGTDLVEVQTLKASVDYTSDVDTDELSMKSVKLETTTLKVTTPTYIIDGKLDIPEYVNNNSIKNNGFSLQEDSYFTEVNGRVMCLGEHNETLYDNHINGNVIYTDKSSIEHSINIHKWGDFHKGIDGNVENLSEGESVYDDVEEQDMDNNYTNYIGLSGFNNISIESASCSNIILDSLNINSFEDGDTNRTYLDLQVFCINGANRADINDANGTFTDSLGVVHTLDRQENGRLGTFYEGNSEAIVYNHGHKYIDFDGGDTFDRVTINNVNSECNNPHLSYLNIDTELENHDDGEDYFTHIDGSVKCDDNSSPTQGTIVYTDKSNNTHNLDLDDCQDCPDNGHFSNSEEIRGNVEQLPLNSGDKHYRAVGWILTPSFMRVEGSSCPNTAFDSYDISLHNDGEENIYNSGVIPKKLKFVGDIKNKTTNGEIKGELEVELKNAVDINLTHNADDKPNIKATLKGKIKMPSRPEMIINLGVDNLATENKYSLFYQYDTTVVNGISTMDSNDQNGTIEFTGPSGIKLVVTQENGEIQYGAKSPVTRNGRHIGQLEERDSVPVIKYTDGTFESLP